jgi:RNA polymerase-interacting CarD/CdnL/TRCF family regulator
MAAHQNAESNWSRRYKAKLEWLSSGDRGKIAELVRNLTA